MRLSIVTVIVALIACANAHAQTTTNPTTKPSTQPAAKVAPAEQVLSQMLKPAPKEGARALQPAASEPPAADKSTGSAAVAPGAPVLTVLPEGTFLVDRTGRLTHSADGQLMEFTFDADGKAMRDPPVIILPNMKLMLMENALSTSGRDLRFRVTGMLTAYRGRNYIMLEKVVVIPDAVQPF